MSRAFVLCITGVYAWWAVGLRPFSHAATAAVLVGGLVAATAGMVVRRPRTARIGSAEVRRWALLAAVMGAWQLAAFVQQPRDEHPTISSLTGALLDSRPERALAFVLWVVASRELARR